MTAAEVSAVASMERGTFTAPWSEATFARLLEPGTGGEVWVAETATDRSGWGETHDDGGPGSRLIGYAVLWLAGDQGELANLAVRPDARGQGIGGRLLDHVLERCREAGIAALYLEVRHSNEVARALYEGRGFRTVGVRKGYYTRPPEDARVMMRPFPIGNASAP